MSIPNGPGYSTLLDQEITQPQMFLHVTPHVYLWVTPPAVTVTALWLFNNPNKTIHSQLIMWRVHVAFEREHDCQDNLQYVNVAHIPHKNDFIAYFQVTNISILPMLGKHVHTSFVWGYETTTI
jgi:hypothetical protein